MLLLKVKNFLKKISLRTLPIRILGIADQVFSRLYSKKGEKISLTGISQDGRFALEASIPTESEDRIFEVNNVLVVGGSSIVVEGKSLIWEQARFPNNSKGAYPLDSILHGFQGTKATIRCVRRSKGSRQISIGLSLLDSLSSHFGHFALGAFPKLRVLTYIPESDKVQIIVDRDLPHQFLEVVSAYFPQNQIVSVGRGEVVAVERLLIPEALKWFPDDIPGLSQYSGTERSLKIPEFDFVFKSVTPYRFPAEYWNGVRILRKGTGESTWRTLLNHNQVASLLDGHGFEAVEHLLNQPLALYKRLSSATHIITDDGSASFNLLLAGVSGKKITILVHPGMGDFQQWFLPGYLSLYGNTVEVIKGQSPDPESKFSDWSVDPKLLASSISH